jgi:hypothetical protein
LRHEPLRKATVIFVRSGETEAGLRERNLLRDSRCREERSKEQVAKPVQWTEDGELGTCMVTAQHIERADG